MRWFGGPQVSIDALVDGHYASLYRYAYRLSGTSQDAEDLTQEVFCQAQKKLFQLRDQTKAKSWLFSILRNTYLHRLRSHKLEKQISLADLPEITERSDEPPPLDSNHLQAALNELPELFRTTVVLY